MALILTLKKSLSLREEARRICRSFSTQISGLRANGENQPYTSLLQTLDENSDTSQRRRPSASALYDTVNSIGSYTPRKRTVNRGVYAPQITEEEIAKKQRALAIERMHHRNWKAGDVYAPHDLSHQELKKWRSKNTREKDVFDSLNINPIHEWKNFAMMYEFMTPLGRIRHPKETGLRNVNQRRIAKAIRRAIGMGFMPSVHEHPEMLRRRQKEDQQLMNIPDL